MSRGLRNGISKSLINDILYNIVALSFSNFAFFPLTFIWSLHLFSPSFFPFLFSRVSLLGAIEALGVAVGKLKTLRLNFFSASEFFIPPTDPLTVVLKREYDILPVFPFFFATAVDFFLHFLKIFCLKIVQEYN